MTRIKFGIFLFFPIPVYMEEYLKNLYVKDGLLEKFERDWNYLTESRRMIDDLWYSNLKQISEVKLIILSESPMWGTEQKFFYNPKSVPSGFFNYKHLSYACDQTVNRKEDLILAFKALGVVFLDCSPYPLNPRYTSLCYRSKTWIDSKQISDSEYLGLLKSTYSEHLLPRLEKLKSHSIGKDPSKVRFCYRYKKVKKILGNELILRFKEVGFQLNESDVVLSIEAQNSHGNIDNDKLRKMFQFLL